MSLDYQKWDDISKNEVDEERREKDERRDLARKKHLAEQERKKREYDEKHGSHGHDHGEARCGCGYVSPEQIEKLKRDAELNPPIPLAEKNAKKMAAVHACHVDGNAKFQEGDYDLAFKIYERGVMIITGTYGLPEEEMLKLSDYELKFDLNMAACMLKLGKYGETITHCKQALNLDKTAIKAYFRMSQAHLGMGDTDAAKEHLHLAAELDPKNAEIPIQARRIREAEERYRELQRRDDEILRQKLATTSLS